MRFIKSFAVLAIALAPVVGCESSRDSGNTMDRKQDQSVSEDGRVATQTRTQTRKTGSGAVVRETEVRKREVLDAPQGQTPAAAQPDATK